MKSRSKGIIISYVNTAVNLICGLFLSSFLLRSLGDTEYGIYQTISSFASYLVLLEFGTGTVMTRNISVCIGKKQGKEEIDKNTSTIFLITLFLSVVILAVSVILYFCIGGIYSGKFTPRQIQTAERIYIFMVGYILASFFMQMMNGVLLAYENYLYGSIVNIIRNLLRVGILVAALINFRYSVIIAITDMCLSIAVALITLIYCKRRFKLSLSFRRFDKEILKVTLPLCFAICLQAIVNQANNNVDKFVIGIMVSPEAVALYSISLYVFTMFLSVTTTPISLYSPYVARIISRGITRDELSEALIPPCRLTAVIGGTVFFGFIAAGRQFVSIVYGEEYLFAYLIAIVLMAPMYINMTNGVLISVLDVLNKRIVRSLALIGTTVANIIMTVLFINLWGILGAAIATAICTVIGEIVVMNIYYKRRLKIRVMHMFLSSFKGVLIYQLLAAAAGFAAGFFIPNKYISFIVCGVIYVAVFSAGFLLFGASDAERARVKDFLRIGNKNKAK